MNSVPAQSLERCQGLKSFCARDIEQLGHVHEGLLDHTTIRAMAPVLGMAG
jgi:hypothetical protein